MESFRNKLKIEEIKEELVNSIDLEIEKKMTPTKIKEELDKYVIGQDHVKRAIAIALSKIDLIDQEPGIGKECYLNRRLKTCDPIIC